MGRKDRRKGGNKGKRDDRVGNKGKKGKKKNATRAYGPSNCVRKFLLAHGPKGLELLSSNYKISYKYHSTYRNLVQLKYNQLTSPFDSRQVCESRGIILDSDDDWRIVAYPYDKFFNYKEDYAAAVDWSTAKVYDKLDGSLLTLYWYNGQWEVATSSLPDARGHLFMNGGDGPSRSFKELFWEIWRKKEYRLPEDTNKCYMFELTSPRNRVIVHQTEDNLVLHGVRDLASSLEEEDPAPVAEEYQWECACPVESISSLEEAVERASLLNPAKEEGYVVCDAHFNRVKIKSPQYVALASMTMTDGNKQNQRRMIQVIKTNEGSEFLSYFPEWKPLYDDLKPKFDSLVTEIGKVFRELTEEFEATVRKSQQCIEKETKNGSEKEKQREEERVNTEEGEPRKDEKGAETLCTMENEVDGEEEDNQDASDDEREPTEEEEEDEDSDASMLARMISSGFGQLSSESEEEYENSGEHWEEEGSAEDSEEQVAREEEEDKQKRYERHWWRRHTREHAFKDCLMALWKGTSSDVLEYLAKDDAKHVESMMAKAGYITVGGKRPGVRETVDGKSGLEGKGACKDSVPMGRFTGKNNTKGRKINKGNKKEAQRRAARGNSGNNKGKRR